MKSYRKNACAVIFNKDKKVLLCQRFETNEHNWQFPQGGIDEAEDFICAAKRELIEETSIASARHIYSIAKPLVYDFPPEINGFDHKGQEQYWSLFYFYGQDDEINLNTKEPEFLAYEWVDIKDVLQKVISFKRGVYKDAIKILEPIINEYKI